MMTKPWLKDPIDVAEYATLYKAEREIAADKILIRFTQTKTRYEAVWRNADFETKLSGDPARLRSWLEQRRTN